MTDDELISDYVDGRLSAAERAGVEARAQADASLRRRIAATQLLAHEARQLPAMAVPRNFILPRDAGVKPAAAAPVRQPLLPTWLLRFGSLAAAGLFALIVVADVMRAPEAAPVSAPMAAPAATIALPTLTGIAAKAATNGLEVATAPLAGTVTMLPDSTPMEPQNSARASMQSADGAGPALESAAAASAAASTASEAGAPAPVAPGDQSSATQTNADVAASSATLAPVPAVEPAPQSTVTAAYAGPAAAAPLITPLRVLALAALIVAAVLGALGWLRR